MVAILLKKLFRDYKKYKLFDATKFIYILIAFWLIQWSLLRTRGSIKKYKSVLEFLLNGTWQNQMLQKLKSNKYQYSYDKTIPVSIIELQSDQ